MSLYIIYGFTLQTFWGIRAVDTGNGRWQRARQDILYAGQPIKIMTLFLAENGRMAIQHERCLAHAIMTLFPAGNGRMAIQHKPVPDIPLPVHKVMEALFPPFRFIQKELDQAVIHVSHR